MDIKRNIRFFSEKFSRNLTVLAVCGALLAVLCGLTWWFFWSAIYIEVGIFIGIAMVIGAVTMRPKAKDLIDQVDTARKEFYDNTADKLKYPSDFEEDSLLVWGYISGKAEKMLKGGIRITDRVQFSLLYLKRNSLYIRTETCPLTEEGKTVDEHQLPLAGLKIEADQQTCLLTFTAQDQLLQLPIQAIDYPLEEFIAKIERQIKKT